MGVRALVQGMGIVGQKLIAFDTSLSKTPLVGSVKTMVS